MTSYILDKRTKWEHLPWYQIEQRVSILKYKIYKASKICDKNLIYKAQNNLVNSNEAKIMAIQYIFKSIKNSYINWNKENYNILDIHKAHIFRLLFSYQKLNKISSFFQTIIQKIEQYIIYLCLESEWNAKFTSFFDISINNHISYKIEQKKIISYNYIYNRHNTCLINLTYYIPSQYINVKYIKKKYKRVHIFHVIL
uniref:Reverse transcriptase N-terminal domain-containing protein n=1 Tax=Gracilaria hainanensis TaxID=2871843 RepID=A0AAU7YP88_9FLOR